MHRYLSVASWHADKAIAAYLSGDLDLYCKHIAISDRMRDFADAAAWRKRAEEMA